MKVGNLIGGLEVVDVKRVNKLNLIQFLKEVNSYLQLGYQIDVTSGRQVGLVLQTDMFKTEAAFGGVDSADGKVPTESVGVDSKEVESVPEESTVQQEQVNAEPVVDTVKEEAPVAPKKTTTRSKKTAQ